MSQVKTAGLEQGQGSAPSVDELKAAVTVPLGTDGSGASAPNEEAPTVKKKRDSFDPYRFGRIQFTSRFFRMLISTPLPEVPSEDLLRPEDLVRRHQRAGEAQSAPSSPRQADGAGRKAPKVGLLFLGLAMVIAGGLGWGLSDRIARHRTPLSGVDVATTTVPPARSPGSLGLRSSEELREPAPAVEKPSSSIVNDEDGGRRSPAASSKIGGSAKAQKSGTAKGPNDVYFELR